MDKLIKALKAVSEPTRLRILVALSQHELTVTELINLLGQSQPRVSRHLKLLVEAGLISRFQEGSWVFQRLCDETDSSKVVNKILELVDDNIPVFDQDKQKLKAIKANNARLAAQYFASHAGDWAKIRTMVGSDIAIENAMLEVANNIKFHNMIDMGTGTGKIIEIFASLVDKATGYDASQEMLKLARANFEQAELNHCHARLGDITSLPEAAGSADLITLHQVLHYLDRPIAVIEEIKRLLTPDGMAIIVDFAKHKHEFLRLEHAHRRLGFNDREVSFWAENNDLILCESHKITHNNAKDSLEVMLWVLKQA